LTASFSQCSTNAERHSVAYVRILNSPAVSRIRGGSGDVVEFADAASGSKSSATLLSQPFEVNTRWESIDLVTTKDP
jgi:hypothetical protein